MGKNWDTKGKQQRPLHNQLHNQQHRPMLQLLPLLQQAPHLCQTQRPLLIQQAVE